MISFRRSRPNQGLPVPSHVSSNVTGRTDAHQSPTPVLALADRYSVLLALSMSDQPPKRV